MENDEQLPTARPSPDLPARRSYTTPELESVIRRAIELQSHQPSTAGGDGVAEADVVRIGQELGLEPAAVRRAMAEVRSRVPEERGALDTFVGTAHVRTSRTVKRPASEVARVLDRYLRDVECMVPQRRSGERTRYVQDTSMAANLSRFTRTFSRKHQPLKLKQLDVSVASIDAETCLVEFGVNLAGMRGGLVAGVFGSSSVAAAGWATTVWATPIADPLMLLGVPVLAGAWAGTRAIYNTISRSREDSLESLLDRLEHDEL